MRLRAGGGMALPDQMVSVVDINYSSFQDSQAHQVLLRALFMSTE